jgi:hypothetical protein
MLKAHQMGLAADMKPGQASRLWMDKTPDRFAYRCTPLPIANCSGWEFSLPFGFEAEWNGGIGLNDVRITVVDDVPPIVKNNINHLITSAFGSGILTFHTGYVFRTDENVALWVRGIPNYFKEGIHPLDGLVETYWLPFTFTMNWKFTRPCKIKFEKDEPFCFITPFHHGELDSITPVIEKPDEQFMEEYDIYQKSREDFINKIMKNDPETMKQKWQKFYFKGVTPTGKKADFHVSKRKLNPFVKNF